MPEILNKLAVLLLVWFSVAGAILLYNLLTGTLRWLRNTYHYLCTPRCYICRKEIPHSQNKYSDRTTSGYIPYAIEEDTYIEPDSRQEYPTFGRHDVTFHICHNCRNRRKGSQGAVETSYL